MPNNDDYTEAELEQAMQRVLATTSKLLEVAFANCEDGPEIVGALCGAIIGCIQSPKFLAGDPLGALESCIERLEATKARLKLRPN